MTDSLTIWLNGVFVSPDEARVSVFDAGLQHGVGLFETMAARDGRVFRLGAHIRRLAGSARLLGLSERIRSEPLEQAVALTAERSGLDHSRLRLTVTGGDLASAHVAGQRAGDPTILIVAQPPTEYPSRLFEEGVVALIADGRLNPLDPMAGHKTLNYWHRIQALQQAAGRAAGEALWFTVSNHVASGSVSNVLLVRDGRLMSPFVRGEEPEGAIPSPVLPGITRSVVLEAAQEQGIEHESRMLDIEDLLGADEVLLTNSSWGVLPIVGVERETIGGGDVGPITHRLREAWLQASA